MIVEVPHLSFFSLLILKEMWGKLIKSSLPLSEIKKVVSVFKKNEITDE